MDTLPVTVTSKKISLGINLTKEEKNLYNKTFEKTYLDTRKWKTSHTLQVEELILWNDQPTKAIYRFNTRQSKIPTMFFMQIEKKNPKTQMEPENIVDKQAILRKKNNIEGIINLISYIIPVLNLIISCYLVLLCEFASFCSKVFKCSVNLLVWDFFQIFM